MPAYGKKSTANLATATPNMQLLFNEVIKYYDCSILCGHRDEIEQEEAFDNKASTKHWPDSTHNELPSRGVDAIPYPFNPEDWRDMERFRFFAGFVLGIAAKMKIKVRSGGDWDGDYDFKDQDFIDMPHFEEII